mgnify:CR=1 FL=1
MTKSFEVKHFKKEESQIVFSGVNTLEDVLEILTVSQIADTEKRTALHVMKILNSREPEEQRNYISSDGYAILADRLPKGFDKNIRRILWLGSNAPKREAHDFGDGPRIVDFDK